MSGNENLLHARGAQSPIALDVYRRSEANIRRLEEKLPEDLVANLAREVILRVASKDEALEHVPNSATPEELERLCVALVSDDEDAASVMIAELRSDGVRAEDIYLKQLSAAARLLGEKWTRDELTFSQVTVGTGRMLAIMRGMRHLFEPKVAALEKAALFAAVPGENHTIGVQMAADFFRKDGWEIGLKVGLDHDALVAEIDKAPSGIVGLSISGEHSIEALSRLVVALHINDPTLIIVVCGSNTDEVKPILDLMGLETLSSDIEDAKQQMATIWDTHMAR